MEGSPTLEEEQAYFDVAWSHREEARAAAKEGGLVGGRYDQIALNEANKKYLAQLAPPESAVAHGAIRLENKEVVYVGRDTIWDKERDTLVINWRSRMGELFERATVKNTQGVAVKRTFLTRGTQIQSFDDLVFSDLLRKVDELTDVEISGVDDALLQDLDKNRTGHMQDIVRTIQAAQSYLIRHDAKALLVIQGGPGTGKSAVALHRASWLLFNEQDLTPEQVLIIGPTDTFTTYIKDVLPGLGDSRVPHLSLRRLGPQPSNQREEAIDTARLKGEEKMAGLLHRALQFRTRFAGSDKVLAVGTGPQAVSLARDQVEAQIENFRNAPTYNAGRQGMRAWIRAQVETAQRESARFGQPVELDLQAIDVALDRVWPPLTAQQFVRDLLGSQNRLQEAAGDEFTAGDVGRLYRRSAATAAAETWADSDVALLDEAEHLINGSPERFLHILVDEAQDLSPMQLRSVARRSTNGAFTIVGDIAQSTGPWSRNTWDQVITALARDEMPVVEQSLTYGYRVPAEIYELAAQLLPFVAPELEPLTVVRKAGQAPQFIQDDGDYDVTTEVIAAISEHAQKGRFLGVIVAPEYKPTLTAALTEQDIKFSDADAGSLGTAVNVVSATEAKGLEFDAVVVVEPAAIAALHRGMRFLYIALTRATKYLSVVYSQAFEPFALEGAEPQKPIDGTSPAPQAPAQPVETPRPSLAPTTIAALSPALVSAAGEWAAQLRNDIAPNRHEAFLAEVARQLGITNE